MGSERPVPGVPIAWRGGDPGVQQREGDVARVHEVAEPDAGVGRHELPGRAGGPSARHEEDSTARAQSRPHALSHHPGPRTVVSNHGDADRPIGRGLRRGGRGGGAPWCRRCPPSARSAARPRAPRPARSAPPGRRPRRRPAGGPACTGSGGARHETVTGGILFRSCLDARASTLVEPVGPAHR